MKKKIIAWNFEKNKPFFLIITLLVFTTFSFGQPGSLDQYFGIAGRVSTPFGSAGCRGYALAIQTDGKIVVAGNTTNNPESLNDFALARYNTDGNLDLTFDGDGKVTTDFLGTRDDGAAIAIQSDGKIVVVGTCYHSNGTDRYFALARYNTDGSLDLTFDNDGKVYTAFLVYAGGVTNNAAVSVAIQTDGKIIAGGNTGGASGGAVIARYNTNGSLDAAFNGTGRIINTSTVLNKLVLQNDGKIVIAGNNSGVGLNFKLARYNANGTLDVSFDGDGMVTTSIGPYDDYVTALTIQSDGKIVAAGESYTPPGYYKFGLVRYNINGSLDPGFDGDGIVITNLFFGSVLRGAAVQGNGKILVAGQIPTSTSDFLLLRYNSNGSLDSGFGYNGIVTTDFDLITDEAYDVAVYANRIFMAGNTYNGSYNFGLAAYKMDNIPPLTNANLSNITLNQSTISPTFASATTSYATVVADSLTAISITPTASEAIATIKVDGVTVASGNASLPVALSNGSTMVSVTVTAGDGTTIKNYTLTITKGVLVSTSLCPGGGSTLTAANTGSSYQWQLNAGAGFVNLSNSPYYAGVNTSSLQLKSMPSSNYAYLYRCLIDGIANSNVYRLVFTSFWQPVSGSFWRYKPNWSCGVLPDAYTDVIINSGSTEINLQQACRSVRLKPGTSLKLTSDSKLMITGM